MSIRCWAASRRTAAANVTCNRQSSKFELTCPLRLTVDRMPPGALICSVKMLMYDLDEAVGGLNANVAASLDQVLVQ